MDADECVGLLEIGAVEAPRRVRPTAGLDAIPHAALMKLLARRMSDRRLLRLLKMWLKAPVAERAQVIVLS